MLEAGLAATIQRTQRGEIRCRPAELAAEMMQDHRRHIGHGRERGAGQAQEASCNAAARR